MSKRVSQLEMFALGFRDPASDAVLSGGSAEFYTADGTFTTPKNAYDDKDKSNPLTSVTLDSSGAYPTGLYFAGGEVYDIRIKDSSGATKRDLPDVKIPETTLSLRTVTAASVTATIDDDVILCQTNDNAITVDLYAVANSVKPITIKNIGSNTNDVTVDGSGAELIDGNPTITLTDGEAQVLYGDSSQWRGQGVSSGSSGLLLQVDVYTSSDTWTKPSGCNSVEVWCIGGGGAGGGVTAVANAAGGGGGGGLLAYSHVTSSLGATEAVTVGSGGSGVSGDDGGSGTNSSFGTHVVAGGGNGGTVGNNTVDTYGTDGAGGQGGNSGTGDLLINGGYGLGGVRIGTTLLRMGIGGGTAYSQDNYVATSLASDILVHGAAFSQIGFNARANAYGTGGWGAANGSTATAKQGGNGAAGLVIVKSYT